MTPDEEIELKEAIMRAELNLKQKQAFWETPRNLVIIIGTIVAATAGIAGVVGFKIGQNPQQITVHLDAPLVVSPTVKP